MIQIKVVHNLISYKKLSGRTSSRSRAKGLERLPCFEYNVLKWNSAFTLELNTAKITDKTKNASNKTW